MNLVDDLVLIEKLDITKKFQARTVCAVSPGILNLSSKDIEFYYRDFDLISNQRKQTASRFPSLLWFIDIFPVVRDPIPVYFRPAAKFRNPVSSDPAELIYGLFILNRHEIFYVKLCLIFR